MFHFIPISFCILCMAASVGVALEPVPVVSDLLACRMWIGFDAPWEAPDVHTPHRYHQSHIPAQHV